MCLLYFNYESVDYIIVTRLPLFAGLPQAPHFPETCVASRISIKRQLLQGFSRSRKPSSKS